MSGLLLVSLSASCGTTGPRTVNYAIFANLPRNPTGIPVEINDGHVFLRARVNGIGPFWFLLDSGAQGDLIHEKHLPATGIKRIDQLRLNDTSGHALCEGASLDMAGASYQPGLIGATTFIDQMESMAGRTIDGVLGAGFFTAFVVELDYQHQRIKLHARAPFRYDGRGERIPIRIKEMLPFISATVTVSGHQPAPGEFLVDTGDNGTIELGPKFLGKLGLFHCPARGIEAKVMQIQGAKTNRLDRLESIRVGTFLVPDPVAEFSSQSEFHTLNRDGAIGSGFWHRFTVLFDYAHRQLILEPNAAFEEPDERDMSGMSIIASSPDLRAYRIESVRPASPAAVAGVQTGDLILGIDGQPASELTLTEMRSRLRRDGHDCSLTVERGGKSISIVVRLQRQI